MIRKELLAVDAGRERLKEESLALKQKVRFFKVEDIDREIAKLEESIAHTTMPLNEVRPGRRRRCSRLKNTSGC